MVKLLLFMILANIIDDYVLQPAALSNQKKKSWWDANAPEDLTKEDYKMALGIHCISWSIMILVPFMVITWGDESVNQLITTVFVINAAVHYVVDDLKDNQKKINLWTNQVIHFCQIIVTWLILSNVYLSNVH